MGRILTATSVLLTLLSMILVNASTDPPYPILSGQSLGRITGESDDAKTRDAGLACADKTASDDGGGSVPEDGCEGEADNTPCVGCSKPSYKVKIPDETGGPGIGPDLGVYDCNILSRTPGKCIAEECDLGTSVGKCSGQIHKHLIQNDPNPPGGGGP